VFQASLLHPSTRSLFEELIAMPICAEFTSGPPDGDWLNQEEFVAEPTHTQVAGERTIAPQQKHQRVIETCLLIRAKSLIVEYQVTLRSHLSPQSTGDAVLESRAQSLPHLRVDSRLALNEVRQNVPIDLA
jgi:hypothetical protein